jgi:hypothetical protein
MVLYFKYQSHISSRNNNEAVLTAARMDGSEEDADQGGSFRTTKEDPLAAVPESKAVFALVANCAHDLKTVRCRPEKSALF